MTWTDSTPLTGGSYIALKTESSSVRFDNIRATTTDSLYYFFTDHLGSTSVLSDSSGNEAAGSRTRYEPFGEFRATPTQTVTDRAFTGQKENMEVGLLYYNARYYLPSLNRFISADTIVPNPQNPQSFNRYSYVENHPINYNDPTGHCGADITTTDSEVQRIDLDAFNECLTLRDFILDRYGIFASGVWKLQELSAFAHGLFDMAEGMGGIEYFRAAFSGVNVIRERGKWADGAGNIARAEAGAPIIFYDGSFQSFDVGRWATIHEFGHIFDMGDNYWQFLGGVHPDGDLSEWLGLFNHILERNGMIHSPGMGNFPDNPDSVVSQYAISSGNREDFAESWAAYHFQGSWEKIGTTNYPYGQYGWSARQPGNEMRRNYIAERITAFQLEVDQK